MAELPTVEQLAEFLERIVPQGSTVAVSVADTGAFHVSILRSDGPVVVLQGRPSSSEFGLTPDLRDEEEAGFDDGHPLIFGDYDQAISALIDAGSGDLLP